MDIKEMRNKPVNDLVKALNEAKKKLAKLKVEVAQAKHSKTHDIRKDRKEIAQILTIIREKQWEEFEKQKGAKSEK
jgi:ribosomal protein L29